MLEKLKQAAVNLAALDLERVALQALRQNEQAVLDFNREQLQDSFDREGEPLGEYASIAYANMKGRITVDLKLTGDFYNAMYLKADEFSVLFDSRVCYFLGCMKRINLIRHLENYGCEFLREGGNHTIYVNRVNQKSSAIPRHREINELCCTLLRYLSSVDLAS